MDAKNELTDVDVDRVDGVKDPAHGRGFLILKSESGDASAKLEQITEVVKTAGETLVSLAKAGFEFPKELADQLADLAKSLELGEDVIFKAVEAPADETEADGFQFKSAEEASELIVKAVQGALPGALKALLDEERETVTKSGSGGSKQVDAQDEISKSREPKKLGEGLFADVL